MIETKKLCALERAHVDSLGRQYIVAFSERQLKD